MADLDIRKSHRGQKVRTPPTSPKPVSTGSDAVSALIGAQQAVDQVTHAIWQQSAAQVDGLSNRSGAQHSEWDSVDGNGSQGISGSIREV